MHTHTHTRIHCLIPCLSQYNCNYLACLSFKMDDAVSGLTDTLKGHLCVSVLQYLSCLRENL
jgi:hypothetical protein